MADLFNSTGTLGVVMQSLTLDVTGSLFITLLIIVIIITAIALALRIPIEFTAVLLVPLLLVLMAFTSEFLAIGGIILIYLAILTAKNFFLTS